MKKNIFSLFCFFVAIFTQISAQIPSGYYNDVNEKKGKEIQIALNQIIKSHRSITYAEVWIYYQYTDVKPSGKIWDIYSDNPQGTPAYEYNYRIDQCSNIGGEEGKCYTREHSFCQSWFGGGQGAPYTDIFHLYPTDGWINTRRSNHPFGKIEKADYTFTNGSKLGVNKYPDAPAVNCYEPIDDFKGDIARSFFYMATRYMFEDENFDANSPMTNKSQLKPWAVNMLLNWHENDPVSQKERDRNNAIYAIQKNRNPFIDHPEWVNKIWGSDTLTPVQITPQPKPEKPQIKWFALTDNRTLKITFTQPMISWTTENPMNYYISATVAPTALHYQKDTLVVHLGGLFSQNENYNLSLKNLLAQNMAFLNDTIISFNYPYQVEQKPLLAWTFDDLPASNTPKVIAADYHLLDTVSEAVLYCDGDYQSSSWLGTELSSLAGDKTGDPRPNPIAGKAIAFINNSANGKSVVFKFPTKGYFNLALSAAVRRTATGFDSHEWEWSLNGENYQLIEDGTTCPNTVGDFVLTTLNLSAIEELEDRYEVFLRLTFDGCTHMQGNNRMDNITIHGVHINDNHVSDLKKESDQFHIFPNPTQGQFQIFNNNLAHIVNTDYVIYNSMGQLVKKGTWIEKSIIDISEQPNGIYFCKFFEQVLKIIKY